MKYLLFTLLFLVASFGYSDSKTDTTIVPKKATGKILFNTQGTEKMQLSNSGSLGIGKTPSRRLDVAITNANNVASFRNASNETNQGFTYGIELQNTASTVDNFFLINNIDSTGTVNSWMSFVNKAHSSGTPQGQIDFTTRNGGNYGVKMSIDKDGNVGIGTTPTQKLHVNGNATVSSGVYAGGLSGKYLGAYNYCQPSLEGNLFTQCQLTLPTGTKFVNIIVNGNYHGGSQDHTGYLVSSFCVGCGNRFFTSSDVIDSGGGNQGFLVQYSGGIISVKNRDGMITNQNGCCLFTVFGE